MSAMLGGRSVELYFINGKPDGMVTAKVGDWTGQILMTPRAELKAALSRKDADGVGLYLLLGEDEETGEQRLYVGQGESIANRILAHDNQKDWWTAAIFVTAAHLNTARAKYLEARLVIEAKAAARVAMDNATEPALPTLSEADQANMETFLRSLFMVLPILRVDCFIQNKRPPTSKIVSSSALPRFRLENKRRGLTATALLKDGEFIVEGGSRAHLRWDGLGSEKSSYALLHAELLKTGVLHDEGVSCTFTTNYAFSSPSAAAAVVNGRPTNGRFEWKVEGTAVPFKQWEEKQLATK